MKQKLRTTFFAFLLLNLPALGQDRSRGPTIWKLGFPPRAPGASGFQISRFSVFRRHRAGPTGAQRAGTAVFTRTRPTCATGVAAWGALGRRPWAPPWGGGARPLVRLRCEFASVAWRPEQDH